MQQTFKFEIMSIVCGRIIGIAHKPSSIIRLEVLS
jgi:hypothetical protein